MINITFKNVDQGDSILLEWQNEEDETIIGIIDCNLKKDKSNPILNYIIKNRIQKIEFMLLSHPHFDHYSGLVELLEFIIQNKIKLRNFLHTCIYVKQYVNNM